MQNNLYTAFGQITRCPITHTSLRLLSDTEIKSIKTQIEAGKIAHLDGTKPGLNFEAAYINAGNAFVYLIVDGIIALLPDLAVVLNAEQINPETMAITAEKQNLRSFYDEIGWTTDKTNVFIDAARFEDLRPVAREYIDRCHKRLKHFIPMKGQYFLDIASGPIQYDAYLEYSDGYDYRICADISVLALREARKKLGSKGIYLLCDITNIPLLDGCMDGFMSLHTIYHVPAQEQQRAFEELHRVLKPGQKGVVVYSWGKHAGFMKWGMLPYETLQAFKNFFRKIAPPKLFNLLKRALGRSVITLEGSISNVNTASPGETSVRRPYYHAHDHRWYQDKIQPIGYLPARSWRSVSVTFMRRYFHPRYGGATMLRILFALEEKFPLFFGSHGQYATLVCNKEK